MSSMVERVIVAMINELERQTQETSEDIYVFRSEQNPDLATIDGSFVDVKSLAKEVLIAIREPTYEMTRAGVDNCAMSIQQDRAGRRQFTTPFDDEVGSMWRAMIDAALKPIPPHPQDILYDMQTDGMERKVVV